jgi:L-rhamnose isomerase/sugar isomerase
VSAAYAALAAGLDERGVDLGAVEARLRAQRVETPSWAYADSGTRFGAFRQAGAPRDAFEKIEDAAEVHRLTGICPTVALHIPWDAVSDYGELAARAAERGIGIGTINPNTFGDERFVLGSLCSPDPAVRRAADEHMLECVEIAEAVGSDAISLWLADGTNFAGQDDFASRRARLMESLRSLYGALAPGMELLVEYKPFEPAFYATDLADWGSALLACQQLGERASVLVDFGHHLPGANIEQIVSLLLGAGRLGGFHFNARRYADDDLIVGSVNPLELFLVYAELTGPDADGVRYMIDQSHNIEPKIEALVESVLHLQEAYAKALLINRPALARAQAEGDVLGANRIVMDAFWTDVRPLCAKVRSDLGADPDPIATHRASGYRERAAEARQGGASAGLGA